MDKKGPGAIRGLGSFETGNSPLAASLFRHGGSPPLWLRQRPARPVGSLGPRLRLHRSATSLQATLTDGATAISRAVAIT
jgi:hypothetical protein